MDHCKFWRHLLPKNHLGHGSIKVASPRTPLQESSNTRSSTPKPMTPRTALRNVRRLVSAPEDWSTERNAIVATQGTSKSRTPLLYPIPNVMFSVPGTHPIIAVVATSSAITPGPGRICRRGITAQATAQVNTNFWSVVSAFLF